VLKKGSATFELVIDMAWKRRKNMNMVKNMTMKEKNMEEEKKNDEENKRENILVMVMISKNMGVRTMIVIIMRQE
jgi:hypothetical protein